MEDLSILPYDLLQAGRKLSFNLGDVFPNLSYPVLEALDRAYLDPLYRTQLQHRPDTLGDSATKDFVLLHVFEIAPELIRRPQDLIKVLLRRHFRNQRIPTILDECLIQVLRQNELFKDWPLEQIVPLRHAFFAFLQERWPAFLDRLTMTMSEKAGEGEVSYGLEFDGPLEIPFDHDDVRVYIDNLFLEGLLHPVAHQYADKLSSTWVSAGLKLDPESDHLRRLDGLIKNIDASLPSSEARHHEWLTFAHKWAVLNVMLSDVSETSHPETLQRIKDTKQKIDDSFFSWVQQHFAGLYNQPPVPPVMLHHIPRAMARQMEKSRQKKIALIVIDGLSLDQWVVLREVLGEQRPGLQFREDAVFAWIPTITSVSRQALFAGKLPLYFPARINTTAKESSLWVQFWLDQGFTQAQVAFSKGLGNGTIDELKELLENPQVCVAGLVVDKVDKIMHGMELGTAGMHNQVRQWTLQGFMSDLIDLLQNQIPLNGQLLGSLRIICAYWPLGVLPLFKKENGPWPMAAFLLKR